FRFWIIDLWRRSLRRRSQKDRMTWRRIAKLVDDFLPRARILHPQPEERFGVKHPRWEPSARIGHVGSVRGALSNERPYRDLRNVVAKYPFEKSHRFSVIQPNSGRRELFTLSCGVEQLGATAGRGVPRGVTSSGRLGVRRYRPLGSCPCTPCGSSGRWQPMASSSRFRSLMRQRSKSSDMMRFCPLSSAILCAIAFGSVVGPIGVIKPSFSHAL